MTLNQTLATPTNEVDGRINHTFELVARDRWFNTRSKSLAAAGNNDRILEDVRGLSCALLRNAQEKAYVERGGHTRREEVAESAEQKVKRMSRQVLAKRFLDILSNIGSDNSDLKSAMEKELRTSP